MLYVLAVGPSISFAKVRPHATSLQIVLSWSNTIGSGFTVIVTVKGVPSQPIALIGTMV